MKKVLIFLLLIGFGIYGIILSLNNKLGIYIHPRFYLTSNIASIFAIAVGVIGIIFLIINKQINLKEFNLSKNIKTFFLLLILIALSFLITPLIMILGLVIVISLDNQFIKKIDILSIVTVMILSLGLILPSRGLSSATADQRNLDFNSINLTPTTVAKTTGFSNDTSNYNIGDWIADMTYNPDPTSYRGKNVNLVGFIFNPHDSNLTTDEFFVARFIITCCAVDARPVGLKVKYDWKGKFKEDQWIRVSGRFSIENNQVVIIPDKVTSTDTPSDPYIY